MGATLRIRDLHVVSTKKTATDTWYWVDLNSNTIEEKDEQFVVIGPRMSDSVYVLDAFNQWYAKRTNFCYGDVKQAYNAKVFTTLDAYRNPYLVPTKPTLAQLDPEIQKMRQEFLAHLDAHIKNLQSTIKQYQLDKVGSSHPYVLLLTHLTALRPYAERVRMAFSGDMGTAFASWDGTRGIVSVNTKTWQQYQAKLDYMSVFYGTLIHELFHVYQDAQSQHHPGWVMRTDQQNKLCGYDQDPTFSFKAVSFPLDFPNAHPVLTYQSALRHSNYVDVRGKPTTFCMDDAFLTSKQAVEIEALQVQMRYIAFLIDQGKIPLKSMVSEPNRVLMVKMKDKQSRSQALFAISEKYKVAETDDKITSLVKRRMLHYYGAPEKGDLWDYVQTVPSYGPRPEQYNANCIPLPTPEQLMTKQKH